MKSSPVITASSWPCCRSSSPDGREDEIRRFLKLGVSKTAIAKLTGVSRTALYSFVKTRGLAPRRPGR